MTERVAALRVLLSAVTEGTQDANRIHAEFLGLLELLRDALLDHFGREEECFFPFFQEHLPDLRGSVEALEAAHDQMCGAMSRLVHLSARGGDAFVDRLGHVLHVFERFEASYTEHARSEREILRQAAQRLDEEQRRALAAAAEGL